MTKVAQQNVSKIQFYKFVGHPEHIHYALAWQHHSLMPDLNKHNYIKVWPNLLVINFNLNKNKLG